MSDLIERLRDPVLMGKWWDQYGMEAADCIEKLERELAEAQKELEWPRCDICQSELQDQGYPNGKVCLLCDVRDELAAARERAQKAERELTQLLGIGIEIGPDDVAGSGCASVSTNRRMG